MGWGLLAAAQILVIHCASTFNTQIAPRVAELIIDLEGFDVALLL